MILLMIISIYWLCCFERYVVVKDLSYPMQCPPLAHRMHFLFGLLLYGPTITADQLGKGGN